MGDLSSGTSLLISATSMALMPMVILGLGIGLVLFFLGAMPKREPSPATRTASLWFLGATLVFTCMMLFMTQVGPQRWLGSLGQPLVWVILLFLAIQVIVIGLALSSRGNPKMRPWGIGLVIADALLVPLFLIFMLLSFDVGSPVGRPIEMPENAVSAVAGEIQLESRPSERKLQSEPRPLGSGPQTEPRPLGSGHSKATSEKKTTKPLPDGHGSDKPRRPDRNLAESESYYLLPNERPDWVDNPPSQIGNASCSTLTVGPYTTRLECDKKMPRALRREVKQYIDFYLEGNPKYRWPIELSDGYIRNKIVRDTWEETKETSVGPMTQVHVLLGFYPETNRQIEQQVNKLWYTRRIEDRITTATVALGTVLVVMLIVYLALKFNVAPKLVPYRWHAIQALVICLLITSAVIALFLCLYVDDNLQKFSIHNTSYHSGPDLTASSDHSGPDLTAHNQAHRAYVQLVTGLWLVLPIMGVTMFFLSIKKKTRVLGIIGGALVLIVILGALLTLGISH